MRAIRVLALLAVALLAASCAGSFHVTGRTSNEPRVIVEEEDHRDDVHVGRSVHPAHLGIPPGHLPPAGQCRVWFPGRPPGHQPAPGACSELAELAPPGAWLVYRPRADRKHVEVSVYGERHPSTVVSILVYEADSGRFVREGRITATR